MPVFIKQITSEVAVRPKGQAPEPVAKNTDDQSELVERVVRLSVERVLERLHFEWGR